MKVTLEKPSITASCSRPRVSDDNPFSEALFRTCKYRPDWPDKGFATKACAQTRVKSFASGHNGDHLHSAIRFVTPNKQHAGQDCDALANRAQLHANARAQKPERKSRKAGQAKPATGNPQDPSGSIPNATTAPLKSETPHEIGGQLV